MYHRRVKVAPLERSFYLVTNRIVGGSFIFGDVEKEHFRKLLFDGQSRYGYVIWDFCIMDNHYHALIEIPEAATMPREKVLRRWYLHQRSKSPGDPGDHILEAFRMKIHDLSVIISNIQQRFTQWYNKRKNRWGRLFGGRFDSVILDQYGAVAKAMAYITLNPVRAEIVDDPAEYRWSGYGERMAKGKLHESEIALAKLIQRELGLPEQVLNGFERDVMKRVWVRFRECLLGHAVERNGIDRQTVAEKLNQANKPLELTWSQRLMLKAHFTTKGVAIGSKQYVEDMLIRHADFLGYRKKHSPEQARAWDEVYCLKKHRVWIG